MALPNDIYLQASAGGSTSDLKVAGTASKGTSRYLALLDHVHPSAKDVVETLTGKTITGAIYSDYKTQSAQFDATSGTTGTTLTNLTGLVHTVVPGTYVFRINLAGVSTANSGLKVAFKLTTTVQTSIEAIGRGMTASALVVQHTTTATDQASLLASTTAIINGVIEVTVVVGTGGTIQVQAAQNASHADTTSVYAGSYSQFTRIA